MATAVSPPLLRQYANVGQFKYIGKDLWLIVSDNLTLRQSPSMFLHSYNLDPIPAGASAVLSKNPNGNNPDDPGGARFLCDSAGRWWKMVETSLIAATVAEIQQLKILDPLIPPINWTAKRGELVFERRYEKNSVNPVAAAASNVGLPWKFVYGWMNKKSGEFYANDYLVWVLKLDDEIIDNQHQKYDVLDRFGNSYEYYPNYFQLLPPNDHPNIKLPLFVRRNRDGIIVKIKPFFNSGLTVVLRNSLLSPSKLSSFATKALALEQEGKFKEAISYWYQAAKSDEGPGLAMVRLAVRHWIGWMLPMDEKKAEKYFKIALDRSFPLAAAYCFLIGINHHPIDAEKGYYYLASAASLVEQKDGENDYIIGDLDAANFMAVCLRKGYGVDVDELLALKIYEVLAKKNHGPGLFNLAIYQRKQNNHSRYLELLQKAVQAEYGNAMREMALLKQTGLYIDGKVLVEQNFKEASDLQNKAASLNFKVISDPSFSSSSTSKSLLTHDESTVTSKPPTPSMASLVSTRSAPFSNRLSKNVLTTPLMLLTIIVALITVVPAVDALDHHSITIQERPISIATYAATVISICFQQVSSVGALALAGTTGTSRYGVACNPSAAVVPLIAFFCALFIGGSVNAVGKALKSNARSDSNINASTFQANAWPSISIAIIFFLFCGLFSVMSTPGPLPNSPIWTNGTVCYLNYSSIIITKPIYYYIHNATTTYFILFFFLIIALIFLSVATLLNLLPIYLFNLIVVNRICCFITSLHFSISMDYMLQCIHPPSGQTSFTQHCTDFISIPIGIFAGTGVIVAAERIRPYLSAWIRTGLESKESIVLQKQSNGSTSPIRSPPECFKDETEPVYRRSVEKILYLSETDQASINTSQNQSDIDFIDNESNVWSCIENENKERLTAKSEEEAKNDKK